MIDNLENAAAGPADPLALFDQWFAEATAREPVDPNAMALATVDADGKPGLRMVLLKAHDERGFVFYTNRESRKGLALAVHSLAALCFHWKSLNRQIRIEGPVEDVSTAESDAYYNSRNRGHRLGAWASKQSRVLANRADLARAVADYDTQYEGTDEIPRPPYWGGYRVKPQTIEFWHAGVNRLHTRLVYTRADDGWTRHMLYP